jgi:hypothetical protein
VLTEYFRLAPPKLLSLLAEQIATAADWEVSLCPTANFKHFDGHRLKSDLAVKVPHN